MRVEDLRYFIRVAESGSISRTAQRHYISQQGLSRIISSLEAELDVKLLHRGKVLQLTPAGKALLDDAKVIEAAYLRMLDTASGMSERWTNAKGSIYTIYATSVLCATLLPGIITTLNKRFPGMFFNVVERLPMDILSMKEVNPRSLAILSVPEFLLEAPETLSREGRSFELLFQDELCVAVAPDNPLCGRSTVTVEDLAELPFVLHNSEILMVRHLLGEHYRPERITHTTNHTLCRSMVIQGMTVGLTSDLIQYANQDQVQTVALEEKISLLYGCVRWDGEDPFVEEIAKVVRESFQRADRFSEA